MSTTSWTDTIDDERGRRVVVVDLLLENELVCSGAGRTGGGESIAVEPDGIRRNQPGARGGQAGSAEGVKESGGGLIRHEGVGWRAERLDGG